MITRCFARIKGLLPVIVVSVCVIEYIRYTWRETELKSARTDEIEKCSCPEKVVYTQNSESQPRPYLIPREKSLIKLNESDLMKIYLRSNYHLDFDLDVYYSFGCDVYTFDPSMDIAGKGKSRNIPSVLTIKEVGLSGKDHVSPRSWQMKTLKTIMKENRHQKTIIDVLKMDIEGGEWDSIPNILESGAYRQIKQLLVEFHFGYEKSKPENGYWGNLDMVKQLRALRMLYEYGFRIFMREQVKANIMVMEGPISRKITPQIELSFVNIAFLQH